MGLRSLRVLLLILVALVAAYVALPTGLVRDVLYVVVGAGSLVALQGGIRAHRPSSAVAWWLIAAGLALWTVGDAVDVLVLRGLGGGTVVTAETVLYLAGYPLLASGVGMLVWARRRAGDREGLIDSAVFLVATGTIAWTLMIGPVVRLALSGASPDLVSIAYAAGDLLILAALVGLLAGAGERPAPLWFGVGATMALVGADSVYALAGIHGFSTGRLLDPLWLGGYLLWAAAGLHPSMRTLASAQPRVRAADGGARLVALSLAAMSAPAALLVQLVIGVRLEAWAIALASITLVGLVMLRMAGLLRRAEDGARRLDELARTDALTGLPNRRRADAELERRIHAGHRRRALVVAMLDLDRFKAYNDTHGHEDGDALLREAGVAWSEALSGLDAVLARHGGDEFIVVASGSPAAIADGLDRVQACTPAGQTVSIGVARWDGEEPARALRSRADAALYVAKRGGRARVSGTTVLRPLAA